MMRVDEIEHERLMYEILGSISKLDAPIIFKGALITKLILSESQFQEISRKTVDIDANWIGEPPTMQHLVDLVDQSLINVSGKLYARALREYGDKKSAGIEIIDFITDKTVVGMDISLNKFQKDRAYKYGELTIRGVLPSEILADKISVISSNRIFRRTKDLIDVYALAHCVEVKTTDIYESHQRNKRILGEFTEFRNRTNDLSHAYQKLRGIDNKPDFEHVYQFISEFVEPFELNYMVDKVWNYDVMRWGEHFNELE